MPLPNPLDRRCPTCRAVPGQLCLKKNGLIKRGVHQARRTHRKKTGFDWQEQNQGQGLRELSVSDVLMDQELAERKP